MSIPLVRCLVKRYMSWVDAIMLSSLSSRGRFHGTMGCNLQDTDGPFSPLPLTIIPTDGWSKATPPWGKVPHQTVFIKLPSLSLYHRVLQDRSPCKATLLISSSGVCIYLFLRTIFGITYTWSYEHCHSTACTCQVTGHHDNDYLWILVFQEASLSQHCHSTAIWVYSLDGGNSEF